MRLNPLRPCEKLYEQLNEKLLSHKTLNKVIELTPRLLKHPVQFLPFSLQQKLVSKILEPLLKQAIEDDELDFLDEKWFKIQVIDFNKSWYFTLKDGQLSLSENQSHCDVCFSGKMNDLVLLAAKKVDPDTLFFRRQLTISGDTELGLQVKNLIDNLELEHLPKAFGHGLNHYAQMVETYG